MAALKRAPRRGLSLEDTVVHRIVLLTKDKHLGARQLTVFSAGSYFRIPVPHTVRHRLFLFFFKGRWEQEEGRKSEGGRIVLLLIR